MKTRILDNEMLMEFAPSIFATQPWADVSERYTFIPTVSVVDALRGEGFFPVAASQSRTRIEGKGEFTKHMLRFRRAEELEGLQKGISKVGDEIPELVLVNSHDRSSGYQLSAGIFRLVCANGMTVKSANFGDISIRHSGDISHEVIEGSYRVIEEMPKILGQIETLKQIQLTRTEQLAYAFGAMELRYPTDDAGQNRSPIDPEQLLTARRAEDKGTDLWTTFNCVQENFMRGGLRGVATTGRRTRTRKIASVNEDLRLNKALWMLTEKMAELHK